MYTCGALEADTTTYRTELLICSLAGGEHPGRGSSLRLDLDGDVDTSSIWIHRNHLIFLGDFSSRSEKWFGGVEAQSPLAPDSADVPI